MDYVSNKLGLESPGDLDHLPFTSFHCRIGSFVRGELPRWFLNDLRWKLKSNGGPQDPQPEPAASEKDEGLPSFIYNLWAKGFAIT